MVRKRIGIVGILAAVFMVIGCHSSDNTTSSTDANSAKSQNTDQADKAAQTPIPPDSIFAKVKEGMGMDEVYATIGRPTSQHEYMTGKSFIPYNFGGDKTRIEANYKGVGRIYFSKDSSFTSGYSVMSIEYDPTEPGYAR